MLQKCLTITSKEILTDLLRGDLGFDGVVVSDYRSIPRLLSVFHTSDDITDAGIQYLTAGLDVECPEREGYSDDFIKAAEQGRIDISIIDRSVERVLRLKFELGLFENPYPADEKQVAALFDNIENEKKSYEAAKKAMTLTKNDGILPLRNKNQKIAVIGPTGNVLSLYFSTYTYPGMSDMMRSADGGMAGVSCKDLSESMGESKEEPDISRTEEFIRQQHPRAKTLVEALGEYFNDVQYEEGCHYKNSDKEAIAEAVHMAKEADVVILSVGGKNGMGPFCTTGEGVDASNLDLPGLQEELMRRVYEVNANMIIVHTDGRPLISEWAYENARAIVEAWLPCTFGGVAIAETLCGENIPGGKLPLDVPRSTGHTPHYHYQHNASGYRTFKNGATNPNGYTDSVNTPLRPFGYGLSYTTFEYGELTLKGKDTGEIEAVVAVKNTGDMAGDEVVQLYGSDEIASIIRPEQELIGYKRITLKPGEQKKVKFHFNIDQLSFQDTDGHWIVEAGNFYFYAGPNSSERVAQAKYVQKQTKQIDYTRRSFFSRVEVEY